jgi:hypothetical protein
MDRERRIAIVGAGAGGLAAAWHLQELGYRYVTVMERGPDVGGLCDAISIDGKPYELGAALLSWEYRHVFGFLRRYEMETTTVAPFYLLDRAGGKVLPLTFLMDGRDKLELAAAVARYFVELARYADEVGGPGFRNLEATDLCQPFGDWLDANGMSALKDQLVIPVTCYGYGRLSEIPAAYALKYLNLGNFTTSLYISGVEALGQNPDWPRKIVQGMHGLMANIAGDLTDLRTDCTIERIDRDLPGPHPIRIRSRTGAQALRDEEFDVLIVACKQDPQTLAGLPMALDPDETALFAPVTSGNFFTMVCDAEGIGYGLYCNIVEGNALSLPSSGVPIFMGRLWEGSPVLNVYAEADAGVTEEAVLPQMLAALQRMNITVGRVHTVRRWRYFPHAPSQALADGFYRKYEAAQGRHATYYAGSVACFECVEDSIEYAVDLVQRLF